MTPLPLHHFLVVGAILFCLGAIGFLARRNLIVRFLCAEMMLQGVAINLVAFARYRGNLEGQAFVLFILTVAACEAAVALALILMLYKKRGSLDVSLWQDLREEGQESATDADKEDPLPTPTPESAGPAPHAGRHGAEHPRRRDHACLKRFVRICGSSPRCRCWRPPSSPRSVRRSSSATVIGRASPPSPVRASVRSCC